MIWCLSWCNIIIWFQFLSRLSGIKSLSIDSPESRNVLSMSWYARMTLSFSCCLGGTSCCGNRWDSSNTRRISLNVFGKLRSWKTTHLMRGNHGLGLVIRVNHITPTHKNDFNISRFHHTCIIAICSRIHWFNELASSLYCCNFFCPSASNNGWPGGGSGKTS